MLKVLALAALLVAGLFQSAAAQYCGTRVQVVNTDYDDRYAYVTLRIFATSRDRSRLVFFLISGNVRAQLFTGSVMNTVLYHSDSITVAPGEEYVEERFEILPLGGNRPVEAPRIKDILVTNCYIR